MIEDSRPMAAIAASAVLWGLWWLPLRWLEAGGLHGDWVSVTIYGAAALVMAPLAWRRRRSILAGGVPLLLIGLAFGAVLTLWNHAILVGEVVRVVLLFYLAPVWATGLGWLLLGERPGARRLLSIALGLGGAAVVLGFEGGVPLPGSVGDWLGLASGLLFALSATLTRKAEHLDGLDITAVAMAAATAIALGFLLVLPTPTPDAAVLARAVPLAGLAALVWLLPQTWLIFWGAARLDPGRVTILLLLEVVAAAASASLLTDEPFGGRELLGCLLILSAGLVEGLARARRAQAKP